MQVDYVGTSLTGKVQEWFHQSIEHFDWQVWEWTLETVMQGLQKRFLHTLSYHYVSNLFGAMVQSTKTIQELINDLTKYAMCMVQPPDAYTFQRRFISILYETLCNNVLKRATMQ